ncbi:FxsA family protein [Flocculibacter collagenilyticus]|uniref:FxsA family protein n=1 Tax=Flocculibacter collagenilyticus TaxID=2744479 RepID=UPI0018F71E9A|nr:FxsA family protein [Flocculibacter collagenilyticus]
MFKVLFLLFLVIPIVEIAFLIQLSDVIGGFATIALVVLTAFVGAKLVKSQGTETIQRLQQKAAQGQIPSDEIFSGICILISGVLLVTPGVFTDVIGFLLLTPPVRKRLGDALKKNMVMGATGQQGFTFMSGGMSGHFQQHTAEHQRHTVNSENKAQPEQPATLEGEFERKD